MSAEENATLLERTAPYITVPSHIVWGQEDQVRFNTFACASPTQGRGFDLYIYIQEFIKKKSSLFFSKHQIFFFNLQNNPLIQKSSKTP